MKRRNFIKTLSLGISAPAFMPFIENLYAESTGNKNLLPKRFVFVIKSSGLDGNNFLPTDGTIKPVQRNYQGAMRQTDKLTRYKLKKETLPEVLSPLSSLCSKTTVLQGLSGNNLRGNHTLGLGLMSCVRSEKVAIEPTIDCILGKAFSKGPYQMYGMAINSIVLSKGATPDEGFCYPNLSCKGKAQQVPFQASPHLSFYELFGSAVLPKNEAQKKLTVKTNLMDFLSTEAKRLETQLSPEDKIRFNSYKDSFESLKVKEVRKSKMGSAISKHAPKFSDKYHSKVETIRQECQFEMATSALISGLTNVITLRPDTLGTVYTGLGFDNHLHGIGHEGSPAEGKDLDSWKGRKMIQKFHISQIAKMAAKLDSIPEGDGTMLDNTLIVYTSCAGGGHHNGWTDFPFVLVGGIGGKLKMGEQLILPSYQNKGHKSLANLYMTLLHASGVSNQEKFGQLDPQLNDLDMNGPISELL